MPRSREEILAEIQQLKDYLAQKSQSKMSLTPKLEGFEVMNPAALKAKQGIELSGKIDEEAIKPPAGDIGGRIALARESLGNIDKIREDLYPNGKFDRGIAFGSNIRASIPIPFLNKVLPTVAPNIPFLKEDDPYVNKAQNLFRRMGSALSARQLIQTGTAARPEETARLVEQYAPNVWSGDESAMTGLNELKNFYKDYLNVNDPTGQKGLNPAKKFGRRFGE